MDNLENIDLVYCFQTKTFNKALEDWVAEQMELYPNDETAKGNILVAAQAMRDFMTSRHVSNHGMVVKQLIENNLKNRRNNN
jgi:hypothetical protein